MNDKLIERLRDYLNALESGDLVHMYTLDALAASDIRLAITALEEAQAENARLREALEGARIRLSGADWIIRTALEQEGTGDE